MPRRKAKTTKKVSARANCHGCGGPIVRRDDRTWVHAKTGQTTCRSGSGFIAAPSSRGVWK